MTQFEKLTKKPEYLAQFLSENLDCEGCPCEDVCYDENPYCDDPTSPYFKSQTEIYIECMDNLKKWLESEVEENAID